jgi:hypothetical protein
VGTTTATRQIPVSELLARHRGEQLSGPQWAAPAPTACETTDVIPPVQDEYYLDEPYAATGYSEGYGYEYAEEPAEAVRPFVGVSSDTDRFPLPLVHQDPDEQTLLAPISASDVEAMDAARAAAEAATVETPACDDETPSREIYIRELLRREGRLPREQRRKQAPKIAAAAAGVAALCGAVAASIVHVQNADNNQNTASGNGVPLTVVDGGGPRGQALDAPLAPRGTEAVTPDNSTTNSTPADKHAAPPRVAPYVTKSQQAQNGAGATSSSSAAAPTTTTTTPPPSPTATSTPSNGGGGNNTNSTPPPTSSSPNNAGTPQHSSTPPTSTSSNQDTGLLGGVLDPITGLLG